MKLGKILTIAVMMITLVTTLGCSAQSNTNQQATATTGDLSVKVSGSGNTSYAVDSKLVFSSPGKIEKVAVKEGDRVAKGAVLAKLETNELELALSQSQVAQAQAQVALTEVQSSQTQAGIALSSAQFNLDLVNDVSKIMDDITKAQWELKIAQMQAEEARKLDDKYSGEYWTSIIGQAEINVAKRQRDLADLLGKQQYSGQFLYLSGQTYDRLVVEDARIKQQQVTAAQQAVDLVAQNVEQAKRTLDQATKAVALAQKNLNDATIIAPFDGVIASLDIKEGDYITTPGASLGVPIYMVDPNSLEINIDVDEIDVAQTQVNQNALISLDALPDVKYEGTVKNISLLPTDKSKTSGVVEYEVKIVFSGNIPASVKSGMSATVDIVTQEKKNVLLIPSKSITKDASGNTTVNVLVNNKTESRQVVTGLTDGTQTEIISGLKAGDIVIKPL
jgi:HlyD family secretion protein